MGIYEDVNSQIKDAMRARDSSRLLALRNVRAAFIEEMKKDGRDTLSDEVCLTNLRRLAKQRVDSAETYAKAGRTDLEDAERAELVIIQAFLPQLADEAQTRAWVEAAIAQTGATSPRQMGQVMGAMMKAHKGEVDGQLTRKLVQALLTA